ncbi:outer membrane beta-barrel protein [bacterium]|nr:outer membrane beta-barrel protein [candidate division CSSED10-310 bacterium]
MQRTQRLIAAVIVCFICTLGGGITTAGSLLGIGASAGFYWIDSADDQFAQVTIPRLSVTFLKYFDAEVAVEFRQKDIHFTAERNLKMYDELPIFLQVNVSLMPDATLNPFLQAGVNFHRLEMKFENTEGADSTSSIGYHAGAGIRYMFQQTFIDLLVRYETLTDTEEFSVYDDILEETKSGEWDGENWAIMLGVRTMIL